MEWLRKLRFDVENAILNLRGTRALAVNMLLSACCVTACALVDPCGSPHAAFQHLAFSVPNMSVAPGYWTTVASPMVYMALGVMMALTLPFRSAAEANNRWIWHSALAATRALLFHRLEADVGVMSLSTVDDPLPIVRKACLANIVTVYVLVEYLHAPWWLVVVQLLWWIVFGMWSAERRADIGRRPDGVANPKTHVDTRVRLRALFRSQCTERLVNTFCGGLVYVLFSDSRLHIHSQLIKPASPSATAAATPAPEVESMRGFVASVATCGVDCKASNGAGGEPKDPYLNARCDVEGNRHVPRLYVCECALHLPYKKGVCEEISWQVTRVKSYRSPCNGIKFDVGNRRICVAYRDFPLSRFGLTSVATQSRRPRLVGLWPFSTSGALRAEHRLLAVLHCRRSARLIILDLRTACVLAVKALPRKFRIRGIALARESASVHAGMKSQEICAIHRLPPTLCTRNDFIFWADTEDSTHVLGDSDAPWILSLESRSEPGSWRQGPTALGPRSMLARMFGVRRTHSFRMERMGLEYAGGRTSFYRRLREGAAHPSFSHPRSRLCVHRADQVQNSNVDGSHDDDDDKNDVKDSELKRAFMSTQHNDPPTEWAISETDPLTLKSYVSACAAYNPFPSLGASARFDSWRWRKHGEALACSVSRGILAAALEPLVRADSAGSASLGSRDVTRIVASYCTTVV